MSTRMQPPGPETSSRVLDSERDRPRASAGVGAPTLSLDSPVELVRSKAGRPLMVVWREDDHVRTRTVLDVTGVLVATPLAAGVVVLFRLLASRFPSPRTTIAMGPGGWVSFKDHPAANGPHRVIGLRRRPPNAARGAAPSRRPWWARVLRANQFS